MHAFRIRSQPLFVLSVVVVAGVIAAGVGAVVHSAPLVVAHAGSHDTGSGSAARQGYTTYGPAKLGNSGSLNVPATVASIRRGFTVVAAHAGGQDTGSGSAARQGYTTYGPARLGSFGSLNAGTTR